MRAFLCLTGLNVDLKHENSRFLLILPYAMLQRIINVFYLVWLPKRNVLFN